MPTKEQIIKAAASMEKAYGLRGKGKERKEPVWKGPEVDGITFSLLSRFLVDRERFRVLVVDGLQSADHFRHKLEYGNMWHVCEEAFARHPKNDEWKTALWSYAKVLGKQYPLAQEQIKHWKRVCEIQFQIYVKYWEKHPDMVSRKTVFSEQTFNVPYLLPSGRVVRLRGKWDRVDLEGTRKYPELVEQENKAKGDIDEIGMVRQLTCDLQTMIYVSALRRCLYTLPDEPPPQGNYVDKLGSLQNTLDGPLSVKAVRYNVVRRPLSGGRGTIKQRQGSAKKPPETDDEFYARLAGVIDGSAEDAPGPDFFFMRWRTDITDADVKRFEQRTLSPILEQLCEWWECMKFCDGNPFKESYNCKDNHGIHWQYPFGVYNVLNEGGHTDLDNYLDSGSEVGLERTTNLFPELT